MFYPGYSEDMVWGGGTGGSGAMIPGGNTDPNVMTPSPSNTLPSPANAQQGGFNAPNGNNTGWLNPTTFSTMPITQSNATGASPLLAGNNKRNFLCIQNNCTATSPDTTPLLYIGFNAQPTPGYSLALTAGEAVLWDYIVPRDAIYILLGSYTNTGSTLVIAGAIIQGVNVSG